MKNTDKVGGIDKSRRNTPIKDKRPASGGAALDPEVAAAGVCVYDGQGYALGASIVTPDGVLTCTLWGWIEHDPGRRRV